LNLGSEIQLAYRDEENKTIQFNSEGGVTNFPLGGMIPAANFFHYMIPYGSEFWEILFKESSSGTLGTMKFALTGRGGFLFSGEKTGIIPSLHQVISANLKATRRGGG